MAAGATSRQRRDGTLCWLLEAGIAVPALPAATRFEGGLRAPLAQVTDGSGGAIFAGTA